ncbi:glycosyl transferase family 4-domain-containing protein [Phakopsora pachyrhizi]|nr:glycosyl transferase family 4-domain-containing protein [Phakopsora pachyrhizi]
MSAITLMASIILSLASYSLTSSLIPRLSQTLISAGLRGRDLLKGDSTGGGGFPISDKVSDNRASLTDSSVNQRSSDRSVVFIPESTGLIAGSVYVLAISLFVPLPFYSHFLPISLLPPGSTAFSSPNDSSCMEDPLLPEHRQNFPHASLSANLASILSLLSAVFLGFLDDVFDIRWRFKLPIPLISSVPLLTAYAASWGSTDIIVPHIYGLRELLGVEDSKGLLSIGKSQVHSTYVYMSMLSTFCTNSINILAGVNGVEVGQSIVICLSIIVNDLLYVRIDLNEFGIDRQLSLGFSRGSRQLEDRHSFSLYLMLPLLSVMLALLKYNWYPARSFVGDTFCYFAGMAFAVVGILGHFSKTILLFFIPQIFNFLYSCPQLFGLIPIPRHRLPARDPKVDRLRPSMVRFLEPVKKGTSKSKLLKFLWRYRLIALELNKEGETVGCSNLTLLNLILIWFGEMREDKLTKAVMVIQVVG